MSLLQSQQRLPFMGYLLVAGQFKYESTNFRRKEFLEYDNYQEMDKIDNWCSGAWEIWLYYGELSFYFW
ncbi:MAG TPA: hypothetical protein DIT95_18535 [Arenibacter sp.]|nr:hypothetical protein [Arenibacter sp.]